LKFSFIQNFDWHIFAKFRCLFLYFPPWFFIWFPSSISIFDKNSILFRILIFSRFFLYFQWKINFFHPWFFLWNRNNNNYYPGDGPGPADAGRPAPSQPGLPPQPSQQAPHVKQSQPPPAHPPNPLKAQLNPPPVIYPPSPPEGGKDVKPQTPPSTNRGGETDEEKKNIKSILSSIEPPTVEQIGLDFVLLKWKHVKSNRKDVDFKGEFLIIISIFFSLNMTPFFLGPKFCAKCDLLNDFCVRCSSYYLKP